MDHIYVASHGNDDADGLSPDRAKRTIGGALSVLHDRVQVVGVAEGSTGSTLEENVQAPSDTPLGLVSQDPVAAGANELVDTGSLVDGVSAQNFEDRVDSSINDPSHSEPHGGASRSVGARGRHAPGRSGSDPEPPA